MTLDELTELSKRIRELINSQNPNKAVILGYESTLNNIANKIIQYFDTIDDKQQLISILDMIGMNSFFNTNIIFMTIIPKFNISTIVI